MNVKEQMKQEEVKEALYQYAIQATGKQKERFPEGNMHGKRSGVEPGVTRFAIPSVTSAMDWGKGDITIDIHHDTGQVKVYEQKIDGENWSKTSLQMRGEKTLSEIINEREGNGKETVVGKDKGVEPKEFYKDTYKEQVLEDISPISEKQRYKEQYQAEILEMLGIGKEPSSNKQTSKGEEKGNQPEKQEERGTKSREERVKEMKEFEKAHSYPEVYRLKKEALQEIKGMNLTESQRAKLVHIEKTLDQEKEAYDKRNQPEAKQEKESKSKNSFSQMFHKFKDVKKTEKPKEVGMDR